MSDPVTGAPTLETRMDDVPAVMDAVGSERAAFFGLSEGAAMSILFAATYPHRTAALIVRSCSPRTLWALDFPWGRSGVAYEREMEQALRIYASRSPQCTRPPRAAAPQGTRDLLRPDGFLAAFDGPARAIRCAIAISDGVKDLGLSIRAGPHAGECEMTDSGLAGAAVHTGARVAAKAGADEVLVSSTVRDLVAGSGIGFSERGAHELKGLPGQWPLFSVDHQPQATR